MNYYISPYFGFKAKLCVRPSVTTWIISRLILDSRQNRSVWRSVRRSIISRLILDSRQNSPPASDARAFIISRLILDSRQNSCPEWCLSVLLYLALFWIQGKTRHAAAPPARQLYLALFWIQGKTHPARPIHGRYYISPYFGFKAKPAMFPPCW